MSDAKAMAVKKQKKHSKRDNARAVAKAKRSLAAYRRANDLHDRMVVAKETEQSWIMRMTGKPKAWWVAKIQELIKKHSKPTKDPWHGTTESDAVMTDLIQVIRKYGFPKRGRYDGNMRMAAILSYVLSLWYLRIHRAKSYDPRRPVKHRQAAYWGRFDYSQALFFAIIDESLDSNLFPGQKWESPFDPYPTDGYFV